MARPIKKGLDYFPLDVGFLSDIKTRKIIRACGKESIHILISLLACIYRDDGYYVLWNEDLAFLVADEVGAKEGTVEELVAKATQVGFFDKSMFDKYKILTSKRIQNTYILATKERKKVELNSDYLLTNEINRLNISINRGNNSIKQPENTQSKEKETKEKKHTAKNTVNSDQLAEDFDKLWKLYPRKERRADAYKAYVKAMKAGATNKEIQDGIIAYKHSIQGVDPKFIAQGGTWFNGQRWKDDYTVIPVAPAADYNLEEARKAYEQ